VFTKPYTLRPIALLPRADLPLSCLDTLSSGGSLPASRLFEAHVKILDLEKRLGITPMVLIARSEDGSSHYVVEREAQDVCVICKLGSWVKMGELCATAVVKKLQASKHVLNGVEGVEGFPNESPITVESSKYSKKKRLAIEAIQSMVKRPSKQLSFTSHDPQIAQPSSDPVVDSCLQLDAERGTAQEEDVIIRPMASEILDNIRSQYFKALYLSKVSINHRPIHMSC
jgi:DNA replication regulator SLD3